jgi:hypothetical protein
MKRRTFLRGVGVSAAAVLLAIPRTASAAGYLNGKWVVRCSNGHDDFVDGVTVNHDCSHQGCGAKSVDGGSALVVCPKGDASPVSGVTGGHMCPTHGIECRRDVDHQHDHDHDHGRNGAP